MNQTTVYAEIVKAERNADGDLVVVGKATGPDLDLDKQVCDPVWLAKAMPQWFSTGGNIREMHQGVAAGIATSLDQAGDSWMVTGTVVDPVSAKKVEAKVLKGYSIGIKDHRVVKDVGAPGGRIIDGQIVEVSLVDRPCNPTCTLTLTKAAKPGMTLKAVDLDGERMLVKVEELTEVVEPDASKRDVSTEERDRLADRGGALPDGSFPIANVKDLRNAIQAIGRAKDPAAAKAHIKRRAKALGKENLIPAAWKTPAADAGKEATHDAAEVTSVRDGLISLIKAELDELEAGEDELCDVTELLCALKMFMCWWMDEAREGEVAAPYTEPDSTNVEAVMLTVQPDGTTKAAVTPPPAPTADGGDRLTQLVKTAIAEASKAAEERITTLEAELAKVKALPAPGGPVLTRTRQDTAKAVAHDALHVKAADYRRLAYEIDDPTTRSGYLQLAAQCDAMVASNSKG